MQKKLKLAVLAMCCAPSAFAQTAADSIGFHSEAASEAAFTFTEAQLGEDDDMTQNVTIVNSNTDIYASQVGYLFSPARFRYRAFDQKYNEVYLNGLLLNDMESGQFRYSQVRSEQLDTQPGVRPSVRKQQLLNVRHGRIEQLQLPSVGNARRTPLDSKRRQPQLYPARHVLVQQRTL